MNVLKICMLTILSMLLFCASDGNAQTAGTFTFKINPVSHSGSYGSKYVVAIWVENSFGTFIKTKLRQSSDKNLDHLATWTSRSNKSIVDATSGATLSSYTPITVFWNGADISSSIVADGEYKIWVELAWDKDKATGKTVTSFPFTKGATAFHSAPSNTSLFTDISLDWVPVVTSIKADSQNSVLKIYPNPTNGIVKIDFQQPANDCQIQVVNLNGLVVYDNEIPNGKLGVEAVDLSKFTNGIYLVNVLNFNNFVNFQYKILLKK